MSIMIVINQIRMETFCNVLNKCEIIQQNKLV
jgi:hypothetical protein